MKTWLAFYPGDPWALWTLALVGQATVLLLAVCAASRILRRLPAVRHALWLSALVGVIVAPILVSAVPQGAIKVRVESVDLATMPRATELVPRTSPPIVNRPSTAPAVDQTKQGVEVQPLPEKADVELAETALAPAKQRPAVSAWIVLASAESLRSVFVAAAFVWGAGMLLFLARLLVGLRAAERLRAGGEPCVDPRVLRLAAVSAEALRLRLRPAILLSPAATGPLFLGLRRPVVLLPVGLPETLDDAALAAVLRHEFAHAARRDTLVGLVEQFVRAVWWPIRWCGACAENSTGHAKNCATTRRCKPPTAQPMRKRCSPWPRSAQAETCLPPATHSWDRNDRSKLES